MLWIISQIMALWNVRVQLSAGLNQMLAPTGSGNPSSMSGSETADGFMGQCWRPWDHIFPQHKGQATPSYNSAGKYCVRLYWMVRITLSCACICVHLSIYGTVHSTQIPHAQAHTVHAVLK